MKDIFWTLTLVPGAEFTKGMDAYDRRRMSWMMDGRCCTPEANYPCTCTTATSITMQIISGSIHFVSADATLFICNMLNSMHWITRSIHPVAEITNFGIFDFLGHCPSLQAHTPTHTPLLPFAIHKHTPNVKASIIVPTESRIQRHFRFQHYLRGW